MKGHLTWSLPFWYQDDEWYKDEGA